MSGLGQLTKNDVKLFVEYRIAEPLLAYSLVAPKKLTESSGETLLANAIKFMNAKNAYLKSPSDSNLTLLGRRIEKLELADMAEHFIGEPLRESSGMTALGKTVKFIHARDAYFKSPTESNSNLLMDTIKNLRLTEQEELLAHLLTGEILQKNLSSEGLSLEALIKKEGMPDDESRKPLKARFEAILSHYFPKITAKL